MFVWIAFLSLCVFETCYSQVLQNESFLTIQSHPSRSHVKIGTRLVYKLELVLGDDVKRGDIEIHINGTFLLPATKPKLTRGTIQWKSTESQSLQNEYHEEDKVEIKGFLVDRTAFGLKLSLVKGSSILQSISGELELFVSDTAGLGSLLRPFLYANIIPRDSLPQRTVIIGEYVFLELPSLTMSDAVPAKIDMKQRTRMTTTVLMPSPRLETSMLKVFLPSNLTMAEKNKDIYSGELFMTLVDFAFTLSSGLTEDSANAVANIVPTVITNSKTSEQDGVVVNFPQITSASTPAEITFNTEAEMLDFDGAHPGIQLNVVNVLKVGSEFFVVTDAPIYTGVVHDKERFPNLTVSLQLTDTYREPDLFIVHLLVGLDHVKESWGSAYDIAVEIYLPSFLTNATLGKAFDVVRSNENLLTTWDDVVLELNLKRLSFAHSARIHMNMTVDMSDQQFVDGQRYTVVTEVLYSGWRSRKQLASLERFYIKIGSSRSKEDCDEKKTEDKDVCDECAHPWDCYTKLPGHGLKSTLRDRQGNRYVCNPASRDTKSWQIEPCVKIARNETVTALDPGVGTMLGATDEAMYGIARNGMAYMINPFHSNTWYGIDENVFIAASKHQDFTAARFIKKRKGNRQYG